ncbi:MAG: MBL fold metallo-hydrolase [Rhodospirillaceae bacterium]|jgi:alkyl sulfatase BDS1-like metallo-beta-lactamase superfamily hydrolase|nr:MBL fold metallo-hydrolase [Rhodospirillaceae bacterium]MBT4041921.1 MBL fold metallo-hydrolase [Rhodospirillaceae bacterium]MBT4691344.1 MBL fold metallo-hydrolase [Rhodospirillaceae bacterium]MBT5081400.1 MBL fold metallo-hydrolase [Rhodospirillaceae bacterium]MBT5522884.1 MBL fold metallo-hydrolase [Rhodospirillaceae bacterium]
MAKEDSTDLKTGPKPASPSTRALQAAVLEQLPFHDTDDFEQARRGLIAALPDGVVENQRGAKMWDLPAYEFLNQAEAPDTINPSLWRMAQLNMNNGLFKVCDRIYQLRGMDLANMTIIEGDSGLIIIDPMTTADVARAGLNLYYAHRPQKPVICVIYSHSHVDHYGGVMGVTSTEDVRSGDVTVIAPDQFTEELNGENVTAGNAMMRRAQFQFGGLLAKGPRGQVDAGLGKVTARGRVSLIAPTLVIVEPSEAYTIDGVEIVFQLAPDSEAPAEMHMFLPQLGVLNMAENTTRLLHNLLPLRGARVRDPRIWSQHITDAMVMFGDQTDILIGQHHWPTWGRGEVRTYLEAQRDLYKFIHDQTVRLMNIGLNPGEIAEALELPPGLDQVWSVRGYYGAIRHNAKAVYQRYLGWYDANPANLNPPTRRETGRKTVEYMGGADAILSRAQADFAAGEYRWVAQVLSHLVFAEPENRDGRALLADTFEQLGYQAESATWRNAYLYAAQELRQGVAKLPPRPMLSPDMLSALTADALFDFMAVRLDAGKAAGLAWKINWQLTDSDERAVMNLQNCTMSHVFDTFAEDAVASVRTNLATIVALNVGKTTVADATASGDLDAEDDDAIIEQLFAMLDNFSMMFDVVAPSLKEEE